MLQLENFCYNTSIVNMKSCISKNHSCTFRTFTLLERNWYSSKNVHYIFIAFCENRSFNYDWLKNEKDPIALAILCGARHAESVKMQNEQKIKARVHCCPTNWNGSSKAMEPSMGVELSKKMSGSTEIITEGKKQSVEYSLGMI